MGFSLLFTTCEGPEEQVPDVEDTLPDLSLFPDFYTDNEDYFITRISEVPSLSETDYTLILSGELSEPCTLSLTDLYAREQIEQPLTIECIGNPGNAPLVSTAIWKGFSLYDLLVEKGMSASVEAVQYRCADGYFVAHSLEQVRDEGVIAALFMNGDTLPALQGYPLRIIVPGYYGVEQPAWVTEIELISSPGEDFWTQFNWDTSPPMPIDTKILFPENSSRFKAGDTIQVGGLAYGGTRPEFVDISLDDGNTWQATDIVYAEDHDNLWSFWQTEIVLTQVGGYALYSRGIDQQGRVQPRDDNVWQNGINRWPVILLYIDP